ncbi:hypothetical protein JAAARDRAFT_43194 [Jaapia argillacea MUCL 33604]|uniref:Uncharacterized protein n=1 Tax=Jaapia argillacea MUCL 33604 TaxID=933084 RepID=A0A067QA17_9AGAM|nr:hypothetical protein JAAARDRAFT_43194 [Jaapia argillacea MUCL 33604]
MPQVKDICDEAQWHDMADLECPLDSDSEYGNGDKLMAAETSEGAVEQSVDLVDRPAYLRFYTEIRRSALGWGFQRRTSKGVSVMNWKEERSTHLDMPALLLMMHQKSGDEEHEKGRNARETEDDHVGRRWKETEDIEEDL